MTHPFFDHPGTIAMAHAGGGRENVENSPAAFAHADALGYRYLDVDLQATSDDVLVALHDDTLDRLTDRSGEVRELPWAEVAQATFDNGESPARFEDLVERYPQARWNVEAKTDAAVHALADLVAKHHLADRICLTTFGPKRIRRMRKLMRGAASSTGGLDVMRLRVSSWLPLPFQSKADVTEVPVNLRDVRIRGLRMPPIPIIDRKLIARAHEADITVMAWTIDDAPEMHELLDLGVDGILTDRPSVLKQVLADRDEDL